MERVLQRLTKIDRVWYMRVYYDQEDTIRPSCMCRSCVFNRTQGCRAPSDTECSSSFFINLEE